MATCNSSWKKVAWERSNNKGKWCPYSAEISQLLEQGFEKELHTIRLGEVDVNLKKYYVDLKQMVQVSEVTGTKCPVRRHFCVDNSAVEKEISWLWQGDGSDVWHLYEIEVINFIETCYQEGLKHIDLSKTFPCYNYKIDFVNMSQRNKRTRYTRSIKRTDTLPHSVTECHQDDKDELVSMSEDVEMNGASANCSPEANVSDKKPIVKHMSKLWKMFKKPVVSDSSDDTSNSAGRNKRKIKHKSKKDSKSNLNENDSRQGNVFSSSATANTTTTYAIVNGKPWHHQWPPHTPQSQIKPVPGIKPLSKIQKTKKKGKKETLDVPGDIFDEFTEELTTIPVSEEQVCIICYEALTSHSTYSDDNVAVKLKLCFHMFHKACLKAMYDSGPKDKFLQCPTCKKIHGEKCGIQPPGEMVYHVLPYALPSFPDCDTIRIIYDIHSGIQGPEHPHPGKGYSTRGFPRHCYLPDNEEGRKVLRLLIKAWQRRLIFTIGRSSTTGEEDTVTWNEIHHKTEFGCSKRGHGFPDPNFFDNILAELEAHGITDSEVYNWYPV